MPTLHRHYLAIHMPKTGGTWLASVLAADGGHPVGLQHQQVSHDVPPTWREGRVVIGTMRDPWSWYASWHAHALSRPECRAELMAWGGGSTDLRAVLEGVTRDRRRAPGHPGVIWPEMGQGDLLVGSGLWTSALRWSYGQGEEWGTEILLDCAQLHRAAGGLGLSDLPPPINTAEEKGRTYTLDGWDEEMVEWVDIADGPLARALGYSGPGEPAHSPLIQPNRWAVAA